MIKKIVDGVWKIITHNNIYFIDGNKKIIIDAGDRSKRQDLIFFLSKVVDPKKVDIVILTHLHYDHVGNLDLFSNAKVYASKEEIEDFKNSPEGAVLKEKAAERLKEVNLLPLSDTIENLQVIKTPGHTKGSVCFWDDKNKILFTGDTMFDNRRFGRTDLPTSVPKELMNSIIKLSRYPYEHLCPGHDY